MTVVTVVNNESLTPAERSIVDRSLLAWWNAHNEDLALDMVTRVKELNAVAARVVSELRNERRERDQFGWDKDPNLRS